MIRKKSYYPGEFLSVGGYNLESNQPKEDKRRQHPIPACSLLEW
jgi:hypothetical protein